MPSCREVILVDRSGGGKGSFSGKKMPVATVFLFPDLRAKFGGRKPEGLPHVYLKAPEWGSTYHACIAW
jgi:hypothetical protein